MHRYNTEDFLEEQFFENYYKEELIEKRKIEPFYYFKSRRGFNAFLWNFRNIIKSYTLESAPLGGEFVLTYLKVTKEASEEEIEALTKAVKYYKN